MSARTLSIARPAPDEQTAGAMQRRRFGATGVELSVLSFGCMRLDHGRMAPGQALDLLLYLHDGGVTSLHSSHEYPAFPFFCAMLDAFRRARPSARLEHVVKIAVPHFDEERFSADRFKALVERQLRALGTERLDLVQWLVRQTPNEDRLRLPILEASRDALASCWEALRREGKVGALAAFPYSTAFADAVLGVAPVGGLVSYLNPVELDHADRLDALEAAAQGFVAIRPLFGGEVSNRGAAHASPTMRRLAPAFAQLGAAPNAITEHALRFPLLHPAVTSVIVSVTSIAHAHTALQHIRRVKADRAAFARAALAFRAAPLTPPA